MVNVALNEILLSEREAEHAIWGQTVNWKGGPGKNMEADFISILIYLAQSLRHLLLETKEIIVNVHCEIISKITSVIALEGNW